MFTGIIEARGILRRDGSRLIIESSMNAGAGDSIAVNGCCLTHIGGGVLTFDLSEETLKRTTLRLIPNGSEVNLESAIKAGAPMGGHFVLGHVDAIGELISCNGEEYRFSIPKDGAKYLVDKGSIAIDGASLTVVEPTENEFSVWMIPNTLESTCFGKLQPGARVNIEYDILARYLERLLIERG